MRLAQFPAFAAAVLLSCVGCARTVALRHVLPAAAPITGRFNALRLKSLNVTPKEYTGLETVFKEEAAKHRHEWTFLGGPLHTMGVTPAPVDVEVTVHVEAKDTKDLRYIRRWDPKTKQTAKVEVPTLVRSVQVRADFVAVPRGGGKNTVVEFRREWKSTEDPRVRGELGLERPDDPQRVPDTRTVVAELFGQHVAEHRLATTGRADDHAWPFAALDRPGQPASSVFNRRCGIVAIRPRTSRKGPIVELEESFNHNLFVTVHGNFTGHGAQTDHRTLCHRHAKPSGFTSSSGWPHSVRLPQWDGCRTAGR